MKNKIPVISGKTGQNAGNGVIFHPVNNRHCEGETTIGSESLKQSFGAKFKR